ncbi:hypothetical protein G6O69_08310 [Pseudenhygromyxa sp. WMMC2535]|uniref:hypothetical protein n=1 Tax=Pseudenhygromyxa sp. WMMC2535 TaxID=2712867 RepID=UPI0015959220|nr:hypothetical protein [Pseudenhygromyxa sp. WMMC2535]NVB37834.1 hypothetical protein [Pseudenhygromyxa sp. WMMC2535]
MRRLSSPPAWTLGVYLRPGRSVNDFVSYKKPRKFNIVVVALLLGLVLGAYLVYVFIPVVICKSEAVRVIDETSSDFTGQSGYMMANPDQLKRLRNKMISELQLVGVDDPNAEYWIEVDDDNQARFGVLYSAWIELAFMEPFERVYEIEMTCSRSGRGAAWTCSTQVLKLPPEGGANLDESEQGGGTEVDINVRNKPASG